MIYEKRADVGDIDPLKTEFEKPDSDSTETIARQVPTNPQIITGTVPFKTGTHTEDEIDRRADEAWDNLTSDSDWLKWLSIGEAMDYARNTCMRETHSNRPAGRGYNEAFSRWLAKRKFSKMDSSDRARLLKVMEHKHEIEGWRTTLTETERKRLNHPSTVWRKWQARTKVSDPTKEKKPSAFQRLREQNIELQEQLHRAEDNDGGNLWTPGDTVKDITRVLLPHFLRLSDGKAEAVLKQLALALKANVSSGVDERTGKGPGPSVPPVPIPRRGPSSAADQEYLRKVLGKHGDGS
jgi:hypothetical protein